MMYLINHSIALSETQIVHFYSAAYAYHGIMRSYNTLYGLIFRYTGERNISEITVEERFEIFQEAWSIIENGDTLRQIIGNDEIMMGVVLKEVMPNLEKDLETCRGLRNKKAHYPQSISQRLRKNSYDFPLGYIYWINTRHDQADSGESTSTVISAEPLPSPERGSRTSRFHSIRGSTKNREVGKPMIILTCGNEYLNLSNFAGKLVAYSEIIRTPFEHAVSRTAGNTDISPLTFIAQLSKGE